MMIAREKDSICLNPVESAIYRRIEELSRGSILVSFRALKSSEIASPSTLENTLLFLATRGLINLFRSDAPTASMTTDERRGMLWVGKVGYNACSLRN